MNTILREDLEFVATRCLPWEKLDGSTVLVSGANGFLPSFMIETLFYLNDKYGKNIHIIALIRNEERGKRRFFRYLDRCDLSFIFQDVCNPINPDRKVDYIIHGASQASPRYYEIDPVGTLCANILGTLNLLEIATKNNAKGLLFFSTGAVLGRIEEKNIPAKEEDYGYINPIDKISCYGESKKMAENICASWYAQFGTPVKIVRPSYVYGSAMPLNDGRAFSDFASKILKNNSMNVTDGEKKTRSFCYISDATVAFFTVLLKGANSEPYNVGTEQETSIKELVAEMIKARRGYTEQITYMTSTTSEATQRGSIDRSFFDVAKIKRLGWSPTISLQDGIRRTFLYYDQESQEE